MRKIVQWWSSLSTARKLTLCSAAIVFALLVEALTVYLGFRSHPFFRTPERTNNFALLLSVTSITALAAIYWIVQRFMPALTTTAETPSFTPSTRIHITGLALASFVVAICLPATFRAMDHPREVMIFWHDEGYTLEYVHAFIEGEKETPDYRITQGWVTFMPVALVLKGLHQFVPVHYGVTNLTMRFYQLSMVFLIVYFTYRLIWQISRSWWLAVAVTLIAYSRREFFHISLAIDRPDTFQLVFVLLSLMFAHRLWLAGEARNWFLAVFFAAFAFASKYSGHLLTPVLLLAWLAYWRQPEVRSAFQSRWSYGFAGMTLFGFTIALVFPFTFFVLSPYHLIKLKEVVIFFQQHLVIYKTGNVYSLPDHEMPFTLPLWWATFTSKYQFDFWLTVLGLAGAATTALKNALTRPKDVRSAGEWLLLAWGTCYIGFLLYQYGLVDYRYIMPAQYVLPFFMLVPLLWMQRGTAVERVPYRSLLGAAVSAAVILMCAARGSDTLAFLRDFRSERSVQACYDVGRYLDRTVPRDEDPRILATNLAYIPPRFSEFRVHNVDVTLKFLDAQKFDFVIMTDNMLAIYADKPTAGAEKQFDPIYKVHFVDVVEAYTLFKHHRHPDYRFVTSFDCFHVFERIDRKTSTVGAANSP